MRRQKPRRIGLVLRFCVIMVVSLTTTLFRRQWRNGDRIPAEGPVIIVVNHVSYADPFVMARFAWDNGRIPRFLGKATLFGLPVIGRLLRAAGQIPVYRGTIDAARSLDAAVDELRRGQLVVMYPEGTVTREPDFWPKVGKTGAARLALLAPDVPMLAVAQWGAQDAVDFYNHRYRLLPRKTVTVSVGAQVDLHRYSGEEPTADTLREMTELIMKAITDELSVIRGFAPPGRG